MAAPKKNVEKARRFLWDDDDDDTPPLEAPTVRPFPQRESAIDQSVNLMSINNDSFRPGPSGISMSGVFRSDRSDRSDDSYRFEMYGDAAPAYESDEFIRYDKRYQRTNSFWSGCIELLRRISCRLWFLLLLSILGVYSMVISVGRAMNDEPIRQQNIRVQIINSGLSSPRAFDSPLMNPQKKALRWLVAQDEAHILYNDPGLLTRYALAVFYFSTNGDDEKDGWENSGNWLSAKGYCLWYGVECVPMEQEPTMDNNFESSTRHYDENGSVLSLKLSGNNIKGKIPKEFARFRHILTLDVSNNQIRGTIPTELYTALPNLRYLLLQNNSMSGTISPDLSKFVDLHELNLAENSFKGTLPTTMNTLRKLRSLSVAQNFLHGDFPVLDKLGYLLQLSLASNKLSGTIPASITSLSLLQELRLNDNKFTGQLDPDVFKALRNIHTLRLNDNQFSGTIPDLFDYMNRVADLQLQNNQLSGTIAPSIFQLVGLKTLDLSSNQLTGPVPQKLALLGDVQVIALNDNQFNGTIPSYIGFLDDIVHLSLHNNAISGTIPTELGSCFRLVSLHLHGNLLEGPEIPTELGQLDVLERFTLQNNPRLKNVTVPDEICQLTEDDELQYFAADCFDSKVVSCECCNLCS